MRASFVKGALMSRTVVSILSLSSLAVVTLACGANPTGPAMAGMAGRGPAGAGGAAGMTMPPGPMGGGPMGPGMKMPAMKPGMNGAAGAIVIGLPTPGSPGTVFPGGGPSGSAPLAPGCTPASAHECPTASGVCATSATSKPTGTTSGSICFYGPITTTTTTTSSAPAATIEYLHETAAGQEYYRFRITFDPAFVDNTYGANAIGWAQRGHTFKDLVGSDHAELSVFDGASTLVTMFDIDYITASTASSCGYSALGVSGGEGKVLVGDAKYVLASTSSLDRNLNGCGYCTSAACGGDCRIDSPPTDAKYTPNTGAPNWDFRVVYEVWMDAAVFAGKGFGGASITFVHASPSKASSNTIAVTPKPCGSTCSEGEQSYQTSSGTKCCPEGTKPVETEFGVTCQSGGCPSGERGYQTSEGWTCCPDGTRPVESSEGPTCKAIPTCPAGSVADPSTGGAGCIPVVE
jgi:hypothetical protein